MQEIDVAYFSKHRNSVQEVVYHMLPELHLRKAFPNDEEYFLFHVKISFHSQDIKIFVLPFWSCKNGIIRKIRLISKF